MPLTIDIDAQLDIFKDAAKKSKVFDLDTTLVKATLSTFTKYQDELLPAVSAGAPGTPVVIDLTNWTRVRGLFVLSNLSIVIIADFNDGNGTREIPLGKGADSATGAPTFARLLMELGTSAASGLSTLSFRNDNGVGGTDAEVCYAIWGD